MKYRVDLSIFRRGKYVFEAEDMERAEALIDQISDSLISELYESDEIVALAVYESSADDEGVATDTLVPLVVQRTYEVTKATRAMLRQYGLDPRQISLHWTRDGYSYRGSDVVYPWPAGFPLEEFIGLRGGVGK